MDKIKKILFFLAIVLTGIFSTSNTVVQAATTGFNIGNLYNYGLPVPTSNTPILDIVSNLLYWLLAILGIVGVIGFVISGLIYLISSGNDNMISKAKSAMVASILGVLVGLSGLVIISFIYWMLGG